MEKFERVMLLRHLPLCFGDVMAERADVFFIF